METQKDQVIAYIRQQYQIEPEHPWAKYPEYATFKANEKWFAVVMCVARKTLQLEGDGEIWVMNVKASPDFLMFASGIPGFLPAYHMNKQYWVTILLDGTVSFDQIQSWLDQSHEMVTDTPAKRIYEAVKKIPKGKVATYGQIAELAGDKKMARAVGNALHKNPDPEGIPCYRVVNSKGELAGQYAFGGEWKQAELLEADGIEIVNGRVDLTKYGICAKR